MKQTIKNEVNMLKQDTDGALNKAILYMTVALFVFCYFGSFSFFEKTWGGVANAQYYKIIYHHLMAFVLFFVFGVVYTKFVMKGSLRQGYGLGVGKWKLGLIFCAIATVIIPLVALGSVLDKDMVATYPLIDFSTYGSSLHLFGYYGSYILYYIGWEFLFRSMGFFSAEKKTGPLTAILLITMLSALIHTSIGGFGKPMMETLAGIIGGFVFGYVTYKTRSIWYAVYMHALIGVFTDVFITVMR